MARPDRGSGRSDSPSQRPGDASIDLAADLVRRWNAEIGDPDVGAYCESGVAESVFDALWKVDPYVRSDSTAAFRCPSGPVADLVSVFNGRRLYDARKLAVPTLLVRGAGDTTSTDADAQSLLSEIETTQKSYAVVPSASHFLLLEKGRKALYQALEAFFTPLPSSRRFVPEHAL